MSPQCAIIICTLTIFLKSAAIVEGSIFVFNKGPMVRVHQGILRGIQSESKNGFLYSSFFNIPYAKAPVGDLRFKNPVAADGWNGIRDASKEGPVCIQYDNLFNNHALMGVEDCLRLNVFVPYSTNFNSSLAVMVWIHGGGFGVGSGNSMFYGPDFLVEKNVILVTLNYRLGALGFLSLGIPDAPGNVGLKDQAMALQWVNLNIKSFGGDPERVTIFGESAGAASVHFHLLSPMSRGLFRNGIAQSGSCLHYWALDNDPLKFSHELGRALGYSTENKYDLLHRLKAETAINIVKQILSEQYAFKPIVETQFQNQQAFLTKNPLDLFKSGDYFHCPFISGFNANEREFVIYVSAKNGMLNSKPAVEGIDRIPVPIRRQLNAKQLTKALENLKEFYPDNNNRWDNFARYLEQSDVLRVIKKTTEMLAVNSPAVYSYNFTYHGDRNIIYHLNNNTNYEGASHFDDIGYIFSSKMLNANITQNDEVIIQRLTKMWTDFAKNDDPNPLENRGDMPKWLPVTPETFYSMHIDNTMKLVSDPFEKPVLFWEKLYYPEEPNNYVF